MSVIRGDYSKLADLFKDEPEALKESIILNHAFDMLEEVGDSKVIDPLLEYMNDDVEEFDGKKCGVLGLLGTLGSAEHVGIIEPYLDSTNHHMSYTALCSMSELLKRNELSSVTRERFVSRVIEQLTTLDCSVEKAVECALTLDSIKYIGLDDLIEKASSKMPDFQNDFESFRS